MPILPSLRVNFELLNRLFQEGYLGKRQKCFLTFQRKARGGVCGKCIQTASRPLLMCFIGYPHPQGVGRLRSLTCPNVLDILIPNDLVRCPWAVVYSINAHTHQPPPPHSTPVEIMKGISNLIKKMVSPNLIMCKSLPTASITAPKRLQPSS